MPLDMGVIYLWDPDLSPSDVAVPAERLGYESFWAAEHPHIPAGIDWGRYPGRSALPELYKHVPDPFVSLSFAAAVTDRIKLGTSVLLMPLRDPIATAKQVGTLDTYSRGRVILGIGAGWLDEQLLNHGGNPKTRVGSTRERVEAMKAIWTNEVAEYHGKHVDFDPLYLNPKPVQRPHPPILVGGGGPSVLDKVIAYGDGWIPNSSHGTPAELARRTRELQRRARAERGLEHMNVTVIGAPLDLDTLKIYADAGISRVAIALRPTLDKPSDLDRLGRFAELAQRVEAVPVGA